MDLPGLGLNIARYTARMDVRVSNKRVVVPFAAASVQTLQVDGVVV